MKRRTRIILSVCLAVLLVIGIGGYTYVSDADSQPGHPDKENSGQFIRAVDRAVEKLSQDHVDEENHQTARQHYSKCDLFYLVVNVTDFL